MMNVREFLRLAQEIHDAQAPGAAPLVLLDEDAEKALQPPLVVVMSTEPVPAHLVAVLPTGSVVLRVARFQGPAPLVVAP